MGNRNNSYQKIYTVVNVISGVADTVYNFKYLGTARAFLKRLKKNRNLDEDDVQIFENDIIESDIR